jgi:hypothetical protein
MHTIVNERYLAKILAFGSFFTTIFVISGGVTDPVNAPKMLVIGITGFCAIAVVVSFNSRKIWTGLKLPIILQVTFLIFMIFSSLFSSSPVSQLLYGSYGRNNGALTYLFLSLIYISALTIRHISSFKSIINAMILAGLVNLIYCLWVIIFGDFVGWNNPYGNILGTLGNPNFVGSFLGIIFSAAFAEIFNNKSAKNRRVIAGLILPVCGLEIIYSHAIQGRVVAAFGLALVLFLVLRSKLNKFYLLSYALTASTIGALSLAGALQHGPLNEFIYKTSVSLRGQYWLAGWNTGNSHPFTGVGMDGFGDWYRRMRDVHALELPGINTVVNTAHNVPIDMFAFGGWPLFLAYLAIVILTGVRITQVILRDKRYDPIFATLVVAWAGYQLQSIISINQIGLAVWGWLLSAALIAYEVSTRQQNQLEEALTDPKKNRQGKQIGFIQPNTLLWSAFGALIGMVLALPPLAADMKWSDAQLVRTLPALEASMENSYFNPPNTMKFATNIDTLEQSNLGDLSRKYALVAVKWNPDSFDLWKLLYLLRTSTPEEKALALQNMKRLDPLNPDVTSIK